MRTGLEPAECTVVLRADSGQRGQPTLFFGLLFLSLRKENGVLREDFFQPLDFILQPLAIRKGSGQSRLKVALVRHDSARR
jgi:hypothetical protein